MAVQYKTQKLRILSTSRVVMPLTMLKKGCRLNMRGPFAFCDLSGNHIYDSENDIVFVAKHSKPNLYLYKSCDIKKNIGKMNITVSKINRFSYKKSMCKNERISSRNYHVSQVKDCNAQNVGTNRFSLIKQIDYDLQQVKKKCIQTRVPKIALLYLIKGSKYILIDDKNDNSGINYIYDTSTNKDNQKTENFKTRNNKFDTKAAVIRKTNNKKYNANKTRSYEQNNFKRKFVHKMHNDGRNRNDEDDLETIHNRVYKKTRIFRQINSNVNK